MICLNHGKNFRKNKKYQKKNNLFFKEKITLGDAGPDIVAYAKKTRPDLIVMDSRVLGGIKDMFFGSISNHVMHKSLIPILIVK